MTEGQPQVPAVEQLVWALEVMIGPKLAELAGANPDDLVRVRAILTLGCIGGPDMPEEPQPREDRFREARQLIRDCTEKFGELPRREFPRNFKPENLSDEAYAEEATRLIEATYTIFQLNVAKPDPRKGMEDIWRDASAIWGKQETWFKRYRRKYVLEKLANWIIEREREHWEQERPEVSPNGPQGRGSHAWPVRWLAAGIIGLLIVLLIALNVWSSSSSTQPSTSPAPSPSTQFGSGNSKTKLYEPKCGVLAASEGDSDDTHRRLASIDMGVAARRIRQPPDAHPSLPFGQVVKIRPFEVVQISAIVQNPGPGPVARGVRLRLSFPTRSSTRTAITASAEAANARPDDRFRTSGVVALVSLNGRPFQLDNFRSVTVQRNERKQTLYWGRFEHFQDCALESKRADHGFEIVTPPPSIDGTLGAGLDDAYRLSMLADVVPGGR